MQRTKGTVAGFLIQGELFARNGHELALKTPMPSKPPAFRKKPRLSENVQCPQVICRVVESQVLVES